MRADDETTIPPTIPPRGALPETSLTDVIDQLARKAFLSALDRRHAAVPYRVVVESAHWVRTTST
jgi:hypothetical protein